MKIRNRDFFNKILGNKRYKILFFASIIMVCIIALCIGIYIQFFYRYSEADPLMLGIKFGSARDTQKINELKNEFNKLFQNKFVIGDSKIQSINKKQNSKDIVYTGYDLQNEDVNFYQIDINIPILNVESEVANKINSEIKSEFYDTANVIMRKMSGYTVYSVNYTAYYFNNIISIVVKSSLKEEGRNEKVSIKTYNYNIENNSNIELKEIIEKTDNKDKKVQSKINSEIEKYNKNALAVAEEFGSTYTRNLESAIYKIENTKEFFVTDSGKLYIIYPYGNDEYTNEVDIVIF